MMILILGVIAKTIILGVVGITVFYMLVPVVRDFWDYR